MRGRAAPRQTGLSPASAGTGRGHVLIRPAGETQRLIKREGTPVQTNAPACRSPGAKDCGYAPTLVAPRCRARATAAATSANATATPCQRGGTYRQLSDQVSADHSREPATCSGRPAGLRARADRVPTGRLAVDGCERPGRRAGLDEFAKRLAVGFAFRGLPRAPAHRHPPPHAPASAAGNARAEQRFDDRPVVATQRSGVDGLRRVH